MGGDDFHAKRKRAIMELIKGKEIATQLQTLLHKPVKELDGPVSAQELALQISRSFTETLSELSSCGAELAQIAAAVDCGGSASSGESKKKTEVKDRRGCYKRRRSTDSWVTVSSTMEDGCAWRKYGQKDIHNSKYPRCYYRCTHKYEGCKATRQVQRTKEEDSILYQITYFNHHTCTQTQQITPNSHLNILDSDPPQHNLISFQTNIIPSKKDPINPMLNNISSSVKQEPKEEEEEEEEDHAHQISDLISEAKSTLQDPWQDDVIGLESFGYKPVWAPMEASGFQSCESTSFQYGLDMEVNQLGDIDYLHYFDDHIYG